VFPVPHALQARIVGNKRRFLTRLFRAVSQTRRPFGTPTLHGPLGATLVLPPWDPTRKAPCPLHGVVPAGACAEDGTRWGPTQPRVLFPGQALRTVCRAKFLAA
jgi:hypothetical protein